MNRRMMGQKLLLYIKQSMLLFVFMFVGALLIYEYAIIGEIAYLLFGVYDILGGWGQAWVIFVTIPVYYSFVEEIYKRRFI